MKKTSLYHRDSLRKRVLLGLSPLLLAPSAMGIIIVHFVEEGPDVRVSFSGSIDLSGAPGTDPTRTGLNDFGFLGLGEIYNGGSGYIESGLGGFTASPIPFTSHFSGITSDSVFGFTGTNLLWDDRHVSGGTPGGVVTELTANPAEDTFVLSNQSLSSLNIEPGNIAEGQVLWTSNGTASDTFVFSRLAPSAVPEPSVGLLGGLALLGLLRRRR